MALFGLFGHRKRIDADLHEEIKRAKHILKEKKIQAGQQHRIEHEAKTVARDTRHIEKLLSMARRITRNPRVQAALAQILHQENEIYSDEKNIASGNIGVRQEAHLSNKDFQEEHMVENELERLLHVLQVEIRTAGPTEETRKLQSILSNVRKHVLRDASIMSQELKAERLEKRVGDQSRVELKAEVARAHDERH